MEKESITVEKEINGIRYIVEIRFSSNTTETLVDKCKRLIQREFQDPTVWSVNDHNE